MGVDAVLVLDEVRDVDRLIGQLTVPDRSVRRRHRRASRQTMVPELEGLVFDVRPDSYYKCVPNSQFGCSSSDSGDTGKPDRVFVSMLSRYWYPGESHYLPGNWRPVSKVCQTLWAMEPGIVVYYIPEPDSLFGLDSDEVIKDAHRLTPERVAELDKVCARAEEAEARPEVDR